MRSDAILKARISSAACNPKLLTAVLALAGLAACAAPAPDNIEQGQATHTSAADSIDDFMPIERLTPADLAGGERLNALATTSLVADVVQAVGGTDLSLRSLLPTGIDPHGYQPSPQDLTAISTSDVIFVNGLGLEEGLTDLLGSASGSTPIVSLSEGIQPLAFGPDADQGASAGPDPHVWLDPTHVIRWAENIAAALSALDPARARHYLERGQAYIVELRELDAWAMDRIASIPPTRRTLIADHYALGYFAAHFDLQLSGAVIPASSSLAEPTAQDLAELMEVLAGAEVRVIFVNAGASQAVVQRVAEDADAQLVPLYIESLSPPGGPATSMTELLKYNVETIVKALSP